ncbi:MAG TPA: hypothetical protein VKY74_03815, partial [Chloroflexia bacterium]|nr:hypothetical protein [Chloroflexia bacterium]
TALLDVARGAHDDRGEARALSRLALLAAHESMDVAAAVPLLHDAARLAEASDDGALRAEIEWHLAQMSIYQGRLAAVEAHGQRALALAQASAQPDLAARSLNALTYGSFFAGDWPMMEARARAAATEFARLGNQALEIDSRNQLIDAQIALGDPRAAWVTGQATIAAARATDNAWGLAIALSAVAMGLLDLGDYAGADTLSAESLALVRAHGLAAVRVMSALRRAAVDRALLAPRAAQHALAAALAFNAEAPMPAFFDEIIAAEQCAVAAAAGRWAAAAAAAQAALAARSPGALRTGRSRWLETEALLRSGAEAAARADLAAFTTAAAANPRYQIAAWRATAVLAAWDRDPAPALAALEAARALATRLDLPGELWPIAAELGARYAAAGQPAAAAAAQQQAAALIQQIAAPLPPAARRQFLRAPQVQQVRRAR